MKDYKNDLCIFTYRSLKCDQTMAEFCVKKDCIKQKGNAFQYGFSPSIPKPSLARNLSALLCLEVVPHPSTPKLEKLLLS